MAWLGLALVASLGVAPALADLNRHHLLVREHLRWHRPADRRRSATLQHAGYRAKFPAEGIIETAKAYGCDLIVMASHGRRGFLSTVNEGAKKAGVTCVTIHVKDRCWRATRP
jgi:nucleotide-binding universal stress UspA family protein